MGVGERNTWAVPLPGEPASVGVQPHTRSPFLTPIILPPGKKYWEYQFQQQPSQEECEGISRSAVFEHFALMHRDIWTDLFKLLFWGETSGTEQGAGLPSISAGLGPPREGEGWLAGWLAGQLERTVTVGLLIRSCLLGSDFASVDLCGKSLALPGPHTLDFA